jgi:hypothetical protein
MTSAIIVSQLLIKFTYFKYASQESVNTVPNLTADSDTGYYDPNSKIMHSMHKAAIRKNVEGDPSYYAFKGTLEEAILIARQLGCRESRSLDRLFLASSWKNKGQRTSDQVYHTVSFEDASDTELCRLEKEFNCLRIK